MEPTREEIDASRGTVLLEFGATWCPHCQVARPLVDAQLAGHTDIRHIWIEDGKGKRLGRTFGVKLWPTLVLIRDGQEVARIIRPRTRRELDELFARAAA